MMATSHFADSSPLAAALSTTSRRFSLDSDLFDFNCSFMLCVCSYTPSTQFLSITILGLFDLSSTKIVSVTGQVLGLFDLSSTKTICDVVSTSPILGLFDLSST
jgi:hypothetical protein